MFFCYLKRPKTSSVEVLFNTKNFRPKSIRQSHLVQNRLQQMLSGHTWVLEQLVINPMYAESTVGRQMLEVGIFPDRILSTTTIPKQRHFFANNRFELVDALKLTFDKLGVENWCFQRGLL
ncbi:hypothetical protein Lpp227_02751 [Lacticaseibacillus paracasei subsp. paracasei Lpp227]|nr:hypothetical protein Lpp227_02751 [Lacticaseibacillus paracasei subsp. paracasei Lpp227]